MIRLMVFWLVVASFSTIVSCRKPVYTIVTSISSLENDAPITSTLSSLENMIIFGPQHLRSSVLQKRPKNSTVFISENIQEADQKWYFTHLKNKHSSQEQKAKQKHRYSQFKANMMTNFKILLIGQALKHDIFGSKFLIWVDSRQLHQVSERVLKEFYKLIQPRWIFFTRYQNSDAQMSQDFGENRYINRRLKRYEQVVPSYMGGSVDAVEDIKNAYQSFLKVLYESNFSNQERVALSLLPIRFPNLFPYTTTFNLREITKRLHTYGDSYRSYRHERSFSGLFDSKGQLTIEDSKVTIIFQNATNYEDKEVISEMKVEYQKIYAKKQDVTRLLSNSNHFYSITANLIDFFIFLILLAVYAVINRKNSQRLSEIKRLSLPHYQSMNKNKDQQSQSNKSGK